MHTYTYLLCISATLFLIFSFLALPMNYVIRYGIFSATYKREDLYLYVGIMRKYHEFY